MAGLVQSKDGWYVKLATAAGTSAERSVSSPVVLAGAVFFPTLVPTNDFCSSTGTSYLYALYYKTGSAYSSPIIGTSASGANTNSNTRMTLGEGVASQVAIHIDGTGTSNGSSAGGSPRRAADQGLQPDEHREQRVYRCKCAESSLESVYVLGASASLSEG